jgi:hypothetical protein
MGPAFLACIRQAMPEFIVLTDDKFLQLRAYLSVAPQRRQISLAQMQHEARQGVSTEIAEQTKFRRHLRQVLVYNEGLREDPARSQKKKSGHGRPPDSDKRADQQIADAWKTRSYRTYEELGIQLHKSAKEIKSALDRHRKRPSDSSE